MSRSPYGALSRLLHWFALAPAVVRELSFDLERQFFLDADAPRPDEGAVFICGLARSGTSILLRILSELDDFATLTYRDMPFVLAPNAWRRLRGGRETPKAAAVERAHGDGLAVDVDSPEAFEEVFWRTRCGPAFSRGARCLASRPPTPEDLAAFADYRALVVRSRVPAGPAAPRRPRRYLSKNNNNLMRMAALCGVPGATLLLPYRDPFAAAASLHRVHAQFGRDQADDPFFRRYMGWLEHHEFGLDHRPFCFALDGLDEALDPASPDYWLATWTAVHAHVLRQAGDGPVLVDHDALCRDPVAGLRRLFGALGVEGDAMALAGRLQPPRDVDASTFRADLATAARRVHDALRAHPANVITERSPDVP